MSNFSCFQLLKCEESMLYIQINWTCLVFSDCWSDKTSILNTSLCAVGNYNRHFPQFLYFINKTSNRLIEEKNLCISQLSSICFTYFSMFFKHYVGLELSFVVHQTSFTFWILLHFATDKYRCASLICFTASWLDTLHSPTTRSDEVARSWS